MKLIHLTSEAWINSQHIHLRPPCLVLASLRYPRCGQVFHEAVMTLWSDWTIGHCLQVRRHFVGKLASNGNVPEFLVAKRLEFEFWYLFGRIE